MMKRSDIRNAYDLMNPTPDQKDKMLASILARAPREQSRAGKYQAQTAKTSRWAFVPAVVALFAVVVAGIFVMGRPAVDGPALAAREPVDVYAELPQLQAADEWQDYLESYTGTAEDDIICHHATWGCRNLEMVGKFDEICSTHNLTLRDMDERMTDSVDFLLEEVGLDSVFSADSNHQTGNCAYWDNSEFYIAGNVQVQTEKGSWLLPYLLQKTRPNVFLSEYLVLDSQETLNSWRYYHSSGCSVTLGIGSTHSFLYAPIGDEAFFVLVTHGPEGAPSQDALEAFAEAFTFSLRKPLESAAVPESYLEIINSCKAAISDNGWSEEDCQEATISPRFVTSREYAAANAGYQLLDIDGNGTLELLLGQQDYIWNLYTVGGENIAVQLVNDTNDGTVYHLHEGGRIVKELTTKDEGWHDCYLLNGISLEQETSIYGKDTDYFDILAGGTAISSQEALDRIHQHDRVDLTLTFFFELSDYVREDSEAVENYMPVIEKYKTALLENWSWEQCDQADISRGIMYGTTLRQDLGWALVDLDGNGVEELIVSDGKQLFDLYTLMPTDGLPGHILCSGEAGYSYSLCKDGTVERRINNGEFTYWSWFRISEIDFVEEQKLILDNSIHRYYLGVEKENSQAISENEAGEYLTSDEKAVMELTLVPFLELPESTVHEANYYYEPIIELYRKAIVESWDPGKCVENGLSLMIGYYGELYDELGHNQVDLNGDGIAELIITDGTNIFDLYTVIHDEEDCALRILDATERKQYFMVDDQTIYCRASNHAASSFHVLLRTGERALYTTEGFVYDAKDPNGPWFFYDGETKGSPYADAENIVDSWQPMAIPFIPFGDGGLVQTGEQSAYEQAQETAFQKIENGEDFTVYDYVAWLIPWREQEFENPRTLYYYFYDANGDKIEDLILGYEDEVTAVWSEIYDEKAGKKHLTLLDLSEEAWAELDRSWPNWDIQWIEDFFRNEITITTKEVDK